MSMSRLGKLHALLADIGWGNGLLYALNQALGKVVDGVVIHKVIASNSHPVEAGRIKMSHLGRIGFRCSRDSTACIASFATVTPFS